MRGSDVDDAEWMLCSCVPHAALKATSTAW